MINTHWSAHQDTLHRLISRTRFGVISDFDGTLSHFVGDPQAAAITPENARLLDLLAPYVTVIALVSGRGVDDLRQKFNRPYAVYYGNHGMETWDEAQVVVLPQAKVWEEPLQTLLARFGQPAIDGVIIENKRVTASVHYRLTADPVRTRELLYAKLAPIANALGLELSEGQYIWEIKPPITVNKGTAAAAIVERYQLESVLFLGDDVTDMTAMHRLRQMSAENALQAVSVGVIHATTPPDLLTACDMTAEGIEEVTALIEWVCDKRVKEE